MDKIFLEGEKVYLRTLSIENATQEYTDWLNNETICQYNSHHRFPNTLANTQDYIHSTSSSQNSIILAIFDKNTQKHIGNIGLQSINLIDSQAEFAILIGEVSAHSKGIGEEASNLIIQHGFLSLNLHRIYCGTSEKNIPMQKLAKKLNFQEEGIKKDDIFKDGKYLNTIHYGLLNPNH